MYAVPFPVPHVGETFNHDSDDDALHPPLQVTVTITCLVSLWSKRPAVGEIDIWLTAVPFWVHATVSEALPHVNVNVPFLDEVLVFLPGLKRTAVVPATPDDGVIVPTPVLLTPVQSPDDSTVKFVLPVIIKGVGINDKDDGVTTIVFTDS